MYELVILALLMRWPMHGYLIASIVNDMIGPHARVSHGRLYPLLAKLEADGLVTGEAAAGGRGQRTFRITDEGRERFHRLAMDTEIGRADAQRLFWTKFAFFDLLQPEERLFLAEHHVTFCKAHVFHLTHQIEDLERRVEGQGFMTPGQREATVFTMRHFVAVWRLEIEAVEQWRSAHPDGGPAGPAAPGGREPS